MSGLTKHFVNTIGAILPLPPPTLIVHNNGYEGGGRLLVIILGSNDFVLFYCIP